MNIFEILKQKYKWRDVYPGEDEYFKKNKHVAGMMTDDSAVVLNPYSQLSSPEKESVANNERVRLYLKDLKMSPRFNVTDEQKKSFAGTPYENRPEVKDTIIARYLTGDKSAGNVTDEQKRFAESIANMILKGRQQFTVNDPQESDFQSFLIDQQKRVPFKYNPDDPNYDYRAAYRAGVKPQMYYDGTPHWSSRFKGDWHPNRYVNGQDTKTSKSIIIPLGMVFK